MNLPRSREGWYLLVFLALSLTGLGLLAGREIGDGEGWLDTTLDIVQGMEAVVVVGAMATYAIMEGISMLAERYQQRRFNEGKAEGKVEERKAIIRALNANPSKTYTSEEVRRLIEERRDS